MNPNTEKHIVWDALRHPEHARIYVPPRKQRSSTTRNKGRGLSPKEKAIKIVTPHSEIHGFCIIYISNPATRAFAFPHGCTLYALLERVHEHAAKAICQETTISVHSLPFEGIASTGNDGAVLQVFLGASFVQGAKCLVPVPFEKSLSLFTVSPVPKDDTVHLPSELQSTSFSMTDTFKSAIQMFSSRARRRRIFTPFSRKNGYFVVVFYSTSATDDEPYDRHSFVLNDGTDVETFVAELIRHFKNAKGRRPMDHVFYEGVLVRRNGALFEIQQGS